MLKASALFYSIVMSLIIAIISGSLILFAGLSSEEFQRSVSMNDLHLNAESGFNLLLTTKSDSPEEKKQIIDLFGKGNDSVLLERKNWGAFEILVSNAVRKNQQIQKIGLAGFSVTDNYCLYIPDNNRPISVCGNTFIKGTAFLPGAGIKRAYIEGENYSGTSLLYGEMKQSKKKLPEFKKQLLNRIVNLRKELSGSNNIVTQESEVLTNSFLNEAIVISSGGNITLKESCSGNIVVISKTMVTVERTAHLEDVIIYAPKIKIKNGFKGNIQVFATDSIILETNVTLKYPSILGIIQTDSLKISSIVVSENDTVSGNIFAYSNDTLGLKNQVNVIIRNKGVVYGQVYSTGFADVQGSIFGNLMCNKILLRTNSSVYENHLLNAIIDRTRLPESYVGINFVEESSYKKVVKWLN